jgi:hypothetical protein
MKMSEDISKIAQALIAFRADATNAPKDTKGNRNYYYAKLPTVLDVIGPLSVAHKIAFTQVFKPADDAVVIETLLAHESGQWILSSLSIPIEIPLSKEGSKTMSIAQAVGSAISYGRRYALLAAFGIAQEDDDGSYGGADVKRYEKGSSELFNELNALIIQYSVSEETVNKWLAWGGVKRLTELSNSQLQRLISGIKQRGV